jgi:hypothetical protein
VLAVFDPDQSSAAGYAVFGVCHQVGIVMSAYHVSFFYWRSGVIVTAEEVLERDENIKLKDFAQLRWVSIEVPSTPN